MKKLTDLETCYYTSKTNRTASCKKRTVPLLKRTVSYTKRTAPCKKTSKIMYARPAQKRQKKRTVPCNKCATSIYGLIDHCCSMKTTEIIANHFDKFNILLDIFFKPLQKSCDVSLFFLYLCIFFRLSTKLPWLIS